VIDDILDVTQSTEVSRQDRRQGPGGGKGHLSLGLGLEASRKEAAKLTKAAMAALKPLGKNAKRLEEIAGYLLKREY
jgi:geranylgeranyl diphosphate synthase, type II